MGISRRCASKWWHRYLELGVDGLHDRSSRPRRSPTRLSERAEAKICRMRRADKVGPDRLAIHLGVPASTIYRVLRRHDLSRLSHLDRQTTRPIRRYERARPGELVHVDVKKLGRIRPGGGHRVHGRQATRRNRRGRSATSISTPPSMTTAAWPTPRPSPTNGAPPPPVSGGEPTPGSEPAVSPSSGS